ncbi:MAG: FtsX-like permease family protein [Acidobacteria bacterium]|nr:MAG: FtsX-like permease family protein [Acidobacteriota bacterium]
MLVVELLKLASVNLVRHKLRTILTMLGMIFGVAAVLSMLSIGAGAEKQALDVIQKMGIRNILVQAKQFEPKELQIIRQDSPGLSLRDIAALQKALPGGTEITAKKLLKTYMVASALGKADSRVLGVTSLYPMINNLEVVEGGFFLPIDERDASQVCVLGMTARRKLFGLNDAVGQQVKINQEWFTVLGILDDQMAEKEEFQGVKLENPNNDIYIPLQTLLGKFDRDPVDNQLDEIVVQIPQGAPLRENAVLISGLIGSTHRQIDDFSLVVPEKLLEQNRQTQRIFNIVMGAIASISLLVGGIGIMNIMLASVLERTNEIGLRRALGARRRDISRQFLVEAISISLTGAVLGISLGYGISRLVSSYSGWSTIVTPVSVILGVGVSASVGLIFGIYPARQASRISPIEALRYE